MLSALQQSEENLCLQTIQLKPVQKRPEQTLKFVSSVMVHLDNGRVLRGKTLDMSYQGAVFKVDQSIEQVKEGDRGVFELTVSIVNGDRDTTQYQCVVKAIINNNICLEFNQNGFIPHSPVTVRRSNGEFEDGWEIYDERDVLPESVKRLYQLRKMKEQMAVCVKHDHHLNTVSYKVFSVEDLKTIQETVKKFNQG
ncbi:MAG: hypothetical protein HON94_02050 [Methylococcales bacterium]|jgi:hypothetical protein|nr:hypothetical protein [Methylococcales bacterium]MBT7409966.1 hypothetical protein [Methylococcales bacterium]